MKGIYKNIINFSVIADGNPSTLVVLDSSEYMDENPEKPKIDILMPGYAEWKSFALIPNQVNVFNSNLLEANCSKDGLSPIPDGIYWITIRVCPYDKSFKTLPYLRTCLLEYSFQNLLLSLDTTSCSQKDATVIERKLIQFQIFIETAKANVEIGNTDRAMDYYRLAEKVISSLKSQYV